MFCQYHRIPTQRQLQTGPALLSPVLALSSLRSAREPRMSGDAGPAEARVDFEPQLADSFRATTPRNPLRSSTDYCSSELQRGAGSRCPA